MSFEKVARLITLLREKTDRGELQWAPTEKEGVYQASFPSYSVRVFEWSADIVVQIINGNGDVVETVKDPDLKGLVSSPYEFMTGLLHGARRKALGVDAAIDEIIREIQS